MQQPLFGFLTVLVLFLICVILAFIVIYVRNTVKPVKKSNQPEKPNVFYIDNRNVKKKKSSKKVTIPLKVSADKLKKYLSED